MRPLVAVVFSVFAAACADGGSEPPVAVVEASLAACAALPLTPSAGMRIIVQECRAAADGLPQHVWVMGCFDCEGAVYGPPPARAVTNGGALERTPTTWVLKVGDNWNGRLVARHPGGGQLSTVNIGHLNMLLGEGFATVNVNHPRPGQPEVPAGFAGSARPRDRAGRERRTGLHATVPGELRSVRHGRMEGERLPGTGHLGSTLIAALHRPAPPLRLNHPMKP